MKNLVLVLMSLFAVSAAHAQFDSSFDVDADGSFQIARADDFFRPERGGPGNGPGRGGPDRGPGDRDDWRGPGRPNDGRGPGRDGWGEDRGPRRPGPGRPGPGGPGRPGGSVHDEINCDSRDHRFASCAGRFYIVDAFVTRENSRAACVEGQSWGLDRGRVWVDRGCRATFRVYYR